MPNYKKHLAGALLFYSVMLLLLIRNVFPNMGIQKYNYSAIIMLFQWLIFTLAGSLFPDIDINSKGRSLFYKIILFLLPICLIFRIYELALLMIILFSLSILVKHRGLFHNLWFYLGAITITSGLLLNLFPSHKYLIVSNSFFFSIGVISHLWLDLGLKKMFRFRC